MSWGALLEGSTAREDETLRASLVRSIDELEETLDESTRSALAWLVADGVLDFRLALPRNKLERGDFHDKFGVFGDADSNWIGFNGSYNDSIQGNRNYESIRSSRAGTAHLRISSMQTGPGSSDLGERRPERAGIKLPDACRAKILRLRRPGRPYPKPDWSMSTTISPPPRRLLYLSRPFRMTLNCVNTSQQRSTVGLRPIAAASLRWPPARERRLRLLPLPRGCSSGWVALPSLWRCRISTSWISGTAMRDGSDSPLFWRTRALPPGPRILSATVRRIQRSLVSFRLSDCDPRDVHLTEVPEHHPGYHRARAADCR